MDTFTHPFYDIEIEPAGSAGYYVKVLSVDGRRFTYELRAPLSEDAVAHMKSLMDAAVFSDLIIEPSADGFAARESPVRLKKHS